MRPTIIENLISFGYKISQVEGLTINHLKALLDLELFTSKI